MIGTHCRLKYGPSAVSGADATVFTLSAPLSELGLVEARRPSQRSVLAI